ncbi:ribonuclease Z [Peptococcus simiae]|uniref:ribonuclease Z n=1 Tax=Peptococcus simiae TaxID=1643805 RepID=UPI00397FEB46
MIDVCLLGTGGMLPLPKRYLTSLLVRVEGQAALIDCGEATQVSLHMTNFSPVDIGHILFTHYHGDHCSGLPGLLMTMANSGRTDPVHLWGVPGLEKVVKGLTVICEYLPFQLVFHEISAKEKTGFQAIGLDWTSCPVKHRVPCLAYSAYLPRGGRFDADRAKNLDIPLAYWSRLQKGEVIEAEGRVYRPEDVLGPERRGLRLSYATDCRPSAALVETVRDSDLLIAEGLYGDPAKQADAKSKGHMVYKEAAKLAKDAGVKELWLTHFSPAMMNPKEFLPETRAIFPATHAGFDRKTTTLRFSDDA